MEPALSGNRVAPPSVGGTDTVEPVYRGMYRYPVFQMMPLHDVHDLPDALKTGTPESASSNMALSLSGTGQKRHRNRTSFVIMWYSLWFSYNLREQYLRIDQLFALQFVIEMSSPVSLLYLYDEHLLVRYGEFRKATVSHMRKAQPPPPDG